MNGKQLKNSILQWAIQGKLVPQDPNDEPASVLLERIRAEKARLVKEGKIKKDKNESIIFRGDDNSHYEKFLATGEVKCIDDEIPFEIPQGWEWVRLGVISNIIGGYAFPSQTLKGEVGYRVIRISDITENGFDNSRLVRYSGAPISESYSIKQGDILMAMTGGTVGKSLYVTYLPEPMLLNQRVAIIRSSLINSDYLNLVIKSPNILSIINDRKKSTNDNISMVDIWSFLIPVPPLSQQSKIVENHNTLLPLIEKYNQAQHAEEELNSNIKGMLRKSILQEAIQGKLVPQISEEGTAECLLEEIRKEKQKLLKEGKLKKKDITDSVIFKGDDNKYYERINGNLLDISDEAPFDLPETWAWCRFSTIVNYRIGKTPARGETAYWHPASIPWVSISDMKEYGLVQNTKERISNEASKVFGAIVPKGTLLMSFKLTVGRTAILDINAFHNEAIISIFPYAAPEVMKHYLFYTLPLLANMGDSKDAIKGKTLNTNSINNLLIPVPPVATQEAIINKIQEAFSNL